MNFKTKTNQNCQKTEVYASPKTKELRTHSSRVGRKGKHRQLGWGGHAARQGRSWRNRAGKVVYGGVDGPTPSTICVRINREEQLGSKTDDTIQSSSIGKQSLKTSD